MSPCFDDRGNVIGKKDGVFTSTIEEPDRFLMRLRQKAHSDYYDMAQPYANEIMRIHAVFGRPFGSVLI